MRTKQKVKKVESRSFKASNGKIYNVVEDKSFSLHVGPDDAKGAKCKDPAQCVVAQAIRRTIGKDLDFVEVGPTITKIGVGPVLYRVATPDMLRHALMHFDTHKTWHLAPGFYDFTPMSPTCRLGGRPNRWKHRKQYNGKRKMARSRALPTRRVSAIKLIGK
jgi:hypothetical protein